MYNLGRLCFLIGVLTCVSIALIESVGVTPNKPTPVEPEYEAAWKKLHYDLYGSEGLHKYPTETRRRTPHLRPEQALEVMRELLKLYEGRTDEATLRRKSRIKPMLEVANVKREKCNQEDFAAIDELVRYNSPYTFNVVPYLRHYRREQHDICESFFHDNLAEAIANLPPKDHELIDDLLDKIVEAHDKYNHLRGPNYKLGLHISFDYITQGILEHLKFEDGEEKFKLIAMEKKRKDSMRQLKDIIREEIYPLCERVQKETSAFRFIEKQGLIDEVDDYVVAWIRNGNTCELILTLEDKLVTDLDELLRFEYNPKKDGKLKRNFKKLIGHPDASKPVALGP